VLGKHCRQIAQDYSGLLVECRDTDDLKGRSIQSLLSALQLVWKEMAIDPGCSNLIFIYLLRVVKGTWL
jgi:hypothetical protein